MWIKVENQYEYYTFAEIDGILGAGIKKVKIEYIGSGDNEGLFISRVTLTGNSIFVISNKITDDIDFTTNIPQLGGNGVFTLYSKPPADYTLYTDGSRFIRVGPYSCKISTIGACFKDNIHHKFRYDRDGVLRTFHNPYDIEVSSHNGEHLLQIENNDAILLILDTEDGALIRNTAITNFTAKGYKYSTSDAGNWSGWYKTAGAKFTGEYQPFGGSVGTKKVGYLLFAESTTLKNYILDVDILEINGVWSLDFNGYIYISTTRPNETEPAIFTNEEVEPQQVTLNFVDYTNSFLLKNHITMGTITR